MDPALSKFSQNVRAETSRRCRFRSRGMPWSGESAGVRKQYHFWAGDEGMDAWDVDRLIRLAEGLPVEQVRLDEIAEIDSVYWFDEWQRPTVRSVVEHCRLIGEVDLRHPIILGPDGRVMDGMHRIARALVEGATVIDAFRFAKVPAPDYRNCRPDQLPYD